MRLDADVVAWLRATGEGYQTRVNAYLSRCSNIEGVLFDVARFRPFSSRIF